MVGNQVIDRQRLGIYHNPSYFSCWYVLPHKDIGCIGSHGKLGIESLSLSTDKQILASAASERTVKFWDVSELHNTPEPSAREKSNRKRKLENVDSKNDFFDGL